jgi:hypothetical protein
MGWPPGSAPLRRPSGRSREQSRCPARRASSVAPGSSCRPAGRHWSPSGGTRTTGSSSQRRRPPARGGALLRRSRAVRAATGTPRPRPATDTHPVDGRRAGGPIRSRGLSSRRRPPGGRRPAGDPRPGPRRVLRAAARHRSASPRRRRCPPARRRTVREVAAKLRVACFSRVGPDSRSWSAARLDPADAGCLRHVVSETARVETVLADLGRGDVTSLARALTALRRSLSRGLRVTCRQVDAAVDGRPRGGRGRRPDDRRGFGGAVLALGPGGTRGGGRRSRAGGCGPVGSPAPAGAPPRCCHRPASPDLTTDDPYETTLTRRPLRDDPYEEPT